METPTTSPTAQSRNFVPEIREDVKAINLLLRQRHQDGPPELATQTFADFDEASSTQSQSSAAEDTIKRRIQYFSTVSGESLYFEGQEEGNATDAEPPVLEYVEVRVTNEGISQDKSDRTTKEKLHEIAKGHSYVRIISPAVNEALRCVVDYFPNLDLSSKNIQIYEPYEVLVFFDKELEDYRKRVEIMSEQEASPTCANRFAAEHIKIVQDFVREKVQKNVDAEKECHARGYATFDMLWLLYKPGSDVYADPQIVGEHEPYVIERVSFSLRNGKMGEYDLRYWNMNADSTFVSPRLLNHVELRFAGEKKITSLLVYPCEYLRFEDGVTEQDLADIQTHFINRGRQWYNLRRAKKCYSFDGTTALLPRRSFTSLVMVDPVQYAMRNQHHTAVADASTTSERATLMGSVAHPSNPLKICSCDRCEEVIYSKAAKPRFIGYSEINPFIVEALTDHQYFLCDSVVEAFLFKTRQWECLHIEGFKDASFDKGLVEHLVMKETTKDLIKSLTRTYIGDGIGSLRPTEKFTSVSQVHKEVQTKAAETTWSADFIQGKGEGITFLLHGRPGVGKTYTAECIADFTERPLLSLTCSDIGVDPEDIEDNLLKWFKLAESWGAILLIDEADIYLEQRQVQDINRNHLVAGFLRALEYFKGILFLTTNRVGTFDEAFISRIHVQIYYEEFSEEDRRKVWDTFFQKLEEERESSMRIPQPTKDYVQSEEMRNLRWNGREIRNAFQVAVALAEAQGHRDKEGRVLVKSDHLKATVQMSKEFKIYLEKLHKQNASKRAAMMGYRYDAFDETANTGKGKETSDIY